MQNDAMTLPRCRVFRRLVTAPDWTSSRSQSENISVWTPRSRLSRRAWTAALGMAPIPIWIVEPSPTSRAMFDPMRSATSSGGSGRYSMTGEECSTR